MSFYIFESASGCLAVYPGEAEALAAFAVDDGVERLLFAADGGGLQCMRLADGSRYIRPWSSCGSCSLPQVLPYVQSVRGGTTLEDIKRQFGLSSG